jgi:hypothetical protein
MTVSLLDVMLQSSLLMWKRIGISFSSNNNDITILLLSVLLLRTHRTRPDLPVCFIADLGRDCH